MNLPDLNRRFALLLQVAIVLLGIGTLGLMLWEPHLEGRNAHATVSEIYFKDPFLAYVYVGSLPFFYALYRAFGLFGDVRHSGRFSPVTVDALRAIKWCAVVIIGFVAGGVIFILRLGDPEDRPAGFALSVLVALAASAIAITAVKCARNLQRALSRADQAA